jgi:hypothetical protein
MRFNEIEQRVLKQRVSAKPTRHERDKAIKSYQDIEKINKPIDDEEFFRIQVNKNKSLKD